MGSQGNPQTFVPYDNKDCSQGLCSTYCPQLCPMVYAPPAFGFPDDDSSPTFSPLIIAIIGILASALILVIYYTFISKYCGNSRRRRNRNPGEDFNENRNQIQHEAWQTTTTGLADSLIKSLGVCKYKKGDGLIEGTDCSVCLTEFQEGEGLRLLPECNHAFHDSCIDTWLKSHSNCPLCRTNIVCSIPLPPIRIVTPVPDNPPQNRRLPERRRENDIVVELENLEKNRIGETSGVAPKTPLRSPNDSGNPEVKDATIEIRGGMAPQVGRSVAIDSSCEGHVLVADTLNRDKGGLHLNNHQLQEGSESSKQNRGEHSKSKSISRVLHCVTTPAMSKSFSGGRLLVVRHEKGRN